MPDTYKLQADKLLARWYMLDGELTVAHLARYELNGRGEIVVSLRPNTGRQALRAQAASRLTMLLGEFAASQVAVVTQTYGIWVPDVVWMPEEKWNLVNPWEPLPFAPDVCIEALHQSDLPQETALRVSAYLTGGAQEVIVVGPQGEIEFHGPHGVRPTSRYRIVLYLNRNLFGIS